MSSHREYSRKRSGTCRCHRKNGKMVEPAAFEANSEEEKAASNVHRACSILPLLHSWMTESSVHRGFCTIVLYSNGSSHGISALLEC